MKKKGKRTFISDFFEKNIAAYEQHIRFFATFALINVSSTNIENTMIPTILLAMMLTATPASAATTNISYTTNDSTAYTPLATDSIGRAPSDEHCAVETAVDFPAGSGQLQDSIRSYIADELKAFYPENEDGVTEPADYKGDISNGKAIVDFHSEAILAALKKDYEQYVKDGGPKDMYMITQSSIHKASENDSIVTYEATSYNFLGGAHGSSWLEGVTFRRSDGSRIDIVLDPLLVDEMQPLLREGLNQYLSDNGTELNVDSLINGGMYLIDGLVPLPSTPTYLTADGVKFVYQQYEIGPYALGIPTFTIPLDKIRPYILKAE